MHLVQMTDLHIQRATEQPKYGRDAAAEFQAAVDAVNALSIEADAMVITGDLVDWGRPDEYAVVAEILQSLRCRSLVIPGNHDARGPLRDALAATHPELAGHDGYIQWDIDDYPVRLIGLDTLIPGRGTGELCPTRLGWLERRLVEQPDRPTILLMHHPPFDTGLWWMDRMGMERGHPELRSLIEEHRQVVRVLCGHQHRAVTTNWGSTVLSICPSVWFQQFLDLEPESPPCGIAEPGAFQIHRWTGSGLVTHTEYVRREQEPIDYRAEWIDDWPAMRERLRNGTRGA